LARVSGLIRAEAPSANIHDFNGSMEVDDAKPESLGVKQLLMRGTVLRNTNMCVGMVVYTGADTRMVRNSRPAPLKQSSLEKITNNAMVIILLAQGLFALTSAWAHCSGLESLKGHWYLYPQKILLPEMVGWWLTFFTLYSNLMPISLYPTVEFCNAFQSYFITNDRKMFYKQKGFNNDAGFGAKARSSNLCQELGQVNYIFSDKTGTLTQNDMELKRVSIAGRKFGTFGDDVPAPGFNGGPALNAARQAGMGQAIDDFWEALAVSHTVMATHDKEGKLVYEAESPDEYALVAAAADMGWKFQGRKGNELWVDVTSGGSGPSRRATYQVLATNAFNSTRKRMSVLVRKGNEHVLLVKGADNVMLERAAGTHTQLLADLKEFSMQGLRTLVIGCKKFAPGQAEQFLAKFDTAQRETENREEKLAAVAEEVEKDMAILGATAIEDKLQDEVPETIEMIRMAGVKLWVLTGDKLETARNIGYSTKVLTESMQLEIIDEEEGTSPDSLDIVEDNFESGGLKMERKALMVTGSALQALFSSEDGKQGLLNIAQDCCVLIACRVSPKQKAECVALIRETDEKPVTLAVGDGANDVPMIQEAQVGVGIAGREGRQAVNNSDFAIAQFKYLQRLMLVHGRWNYVRAAKFTLFTFWRNMVQVLMIMHYTWMSGFSGTSLYEDWIRLSFNVLCTLPILAVGCLDEDVPENIVLSKPQLYRTGRMNDEMSGTKVLHMLFSAIAHSMVLYFVTMSAFPGMEILGSGDYYTFGTTCYTCLLIDVNYRAVFLTHTHTVWSIGSVFVSFAMYALWLIVYPSRKLVSAMLAPNMYGVPQHMVKTLNFWLCLIAVPMFACVMDVFFMFFYYHFNPTLRDKELQKVAQGSRSGCDAAIPKETNSRNEQKDLLDDATSEDSDSAESEWLHEFTSEDKRLIDTGAFAQRMIWRKRILCRSPSTTTLIAGLVSGVVLLLFGGASIHFSEACNQVRIQYATSNNPHTSFIEWIYAKVPFGTRDYEFVDATKNCTNTTKCTVHIYLNRTLMNPLVYYAVGPFYQNYNAYMRSELIQELEGEQVTEYDRERFCVPETRVFDGKNVVPCGMKATSVFNDTFNIKNIGLGGKLNTSGQAWRSDIERYNNPPDYPGRANTSWLFERYEGVVSKEKGVKDDGFVDWMRPAALPRVWKRYAKLDNQTLEAGTIVELEITSNFPIDSINGGFKRVVLTEIGPMGARHSGFGYVLVIAGILSFFFSGVAVCTDWLRVNEKCQRLFDYEQVAGTDSEEGSSVNDLE